ncbi:glycosyltransferase family 2 protein [Pseudoroseomonas globiformis]|uniref:Glycosyltransferase family 2 protein n=1 Tax=Teichococcus globiformis TaxID=2307229 RepID=A0ABV7FUX8_9PROT
MSGKRPDITAILNVHREGVLAHSSLRSMLEARRVAAAEGLRVEIIIAADCPDAAMRDYLDTVPRADAEILELTVDDLGLARNAAAASGKGRYFAFLDGDDLWSSNWLAQAYRCAENSNEPTVWHPEANLYFGAETSPIWMMHHDLDTEAGDWVTLGLRNHWTSLSFSPREVLERVPYRPSAIREGFGYEDWCWNGETVSQGLLHRKVPGTVHLVRIQPHSLVRRTSAEQALVTPFSLFRKRIGSSTKSLTTAHGRTASRQAGS